MKMINICAVMALSSFFMYSITAMIELDSLVGESSEIRCKSTKTGEIKNTVLSTVGENPGDFSGASCRMLGKDFVPVRFKETESKSAIKSVLNN